MSTYKVVWLKRAAKDAESLAGLSLDRAARHWSTLWREFNHELYWCHVVNEQTGQVLKPAELSADVQLVGQVREGLHMVPPFPAMGEGARP